jgi:hypothetical protein
MGWRRVVVAVIGSLVALSIGASLASPHVVPRLGLLPKPGAESWYDGCNWHGRQYERSGVLWTYSEDSTTRACPPGGLPEAEA